MSRFVRVVPVAVIFWVAALGLPFLAESEPLESESVQARTPPTTAQIAQRVTPSAVTITTADGSGSDVAIDSSGVVVTNLHVIEGQSQAAIELANGDVYDDVDVIDVDERRDLVLLKIEAFNSSAVFGDSDDV